jgi:hypothetical protein
MREVIVAVVSSLATALVLWIVGWIVRVPVQIFIPQGAVVAFNATSCPDGWTPYQHAEGRAILGVGRISPDGPELLLEQVGGARQVALRIQNLPAHKHDTLLAAQREYSEWGQGPARTSVWGTKADYHETGLTSSVGSETPTPFEILPPYVALRCCRKG